MATTTSTLLIQEFMDNFHYSRRLLPEAATMAPPPAAAGISHDPVDDLPIGNHVNSFDANVIMVFAVLVSALICSIVLNSIIKCVFRCSTLILVNSYSNHTNPSSTNNRIKKNALKTFSVITYTIELKQSGIDNKCVICLSEFAVGEKVKVLPKCNHGFHVKCINKWLTCRHCLIETCQKIINGDSSATTNAISSAPIEEIVIRIEPLEREGIMPN